MRSMEGSSSAASAAPDDVVGGEGTADWQRRVVGRSLDGARRRSIDRGARLIRAAAKVLERTHGESLTVQEVADEAGQSLRTLYQYFASKDDLLLAVYEEAMGTYARIIVAAIDPLEDPVERLAGSLIASTRLPALHDKTGVDRGLSRLRLQLGQADPGLIARSQAPVIDVFRGLVDEALSGGSSEVMAAEVGTFFVLAQRNALTLSMTLGNEYGVALPEPVDLSVFCLAGLGIARPREWHDDVDGRLDLSGDDGPSILRRLAKGPKSAG